MAKAMLITEMPTSCDVCEYVDNSDPRASWCGIPSYQMNVTDYVACRHEHCPLRECPQKKEVLKREQYEFGSIGLAFTEGYNRCIDEILGGGE